MLDRDVLEVQQGVWINERWIRAAKLGTRLQVIVQPGEIRILPVSDEGEQEVSTRGWDVFLSLGHAARSGRLPNAAVGHDRYLYGKAQ